MQPTLSDDDHTLDLPLTLKIDVSKPICWVEAGWQDFRHMPLRSGFYGDDSVYCLGRYTCCVGICRQHGILAHVTGSP